MDGITFVNQWLPIWTWPSLPEYNCSRVMPTGVNWTTTRGVSHPIFGVWSMFWGTLCEVLYVPCIYALYKEVGLSCYRIMMWLAVVDVVAIFCNSICFGFFLIEGTVFCSRPWFVWIVGCVGLGMWCGACIGCLLLVTYRLFELLNIGRSFEARTNLLLTIATLYALYFAFLTPPILTNSEFKAMFYDPFIGDVPTEMYVNWPHTTNNLLIVMTSATLYILLIVVVRSKEARLPITLKLEHPFQKSKSCEARRRNRIAVSGSIFIQASIICVFSVAASLEYIYMNFFPTPQILIELGHFSWQISHGIPPFVYLTLNRTVKRHCRDLFNLKYQANQNSIHTTTSKASKNVHSANNYY